MVASDALPTDATGPFVTAFLDDKSSIVELAVAGRWNPDLWLHANRTAGKCLAGHPAGLLLNLLGLDDAYGASAPLWFATEARAHRMTPPVPVVVCVRDGSSLVTELNRLAVSRRLPLFTDAPAARAVLAGKRTLTDQVRFALPPEPRSAAVAGQVVIAACLEWNLAAVASRARLVTSELVLNAVQHAGTEIHLTVTRLGPHNAGMVRRHDGLRISVHDLEPHLPPLPHGSPPQLRPATDRGQGLHIVDAAADHWGALPTQHGKMVWAVLRDRGAPPG